MLHEGNGKELIEFATENQMKIIAWHTFWP